MATKKALREFQSQLAQRLQSAQAVGVTASWLAVESGQWRLLFPLNHAGEIFAWTDVQRVPYTKPWFVGVANLRGALTSVVDVASFVAGAEVNRRRTDLDLAQCRLVTLNPVLGAGCALLVDRLAGLRTPEAFASSAQNDRPEPYWGHVYTDLEGQQWREVNLQALSEHPAFLGVGQ